MSADRTSPLPVTSTGQQAAWNDFLRVYLDDRNAGRMRTLGEYQALFPGLEAELARELELLQRSSTDTLDLSEPSLGQTFGAYVLERPLGRGGQGRVWLARDTRLARPVALKLLTELAALSPHALERFRREAQVASRLSDPGICTVYETGIERGVPFIAMRHVEGETLAQRLDAARPGGEPPLELPAEQGREEQHLSATERVAQLVERIARSLHEAHQAGIVHRDVKPGNVMLGRDGLPVLVDFGLASVQDSELATLTRTGDALGTPAYMSPEQLADGSHRVDRRTDVYALGVVLYECLTLRRPFEADSREALQRSILADEPADPRRHLPAIPEDLRTILAVALERDRERRYATAAALAEDLRRYRAGEPVLARAPSQVYRMKKLVRRHRVLAGSAVVVALVLAIATAFVTHAMLRERASAADVWRLSAIQDLEELVADARRLVPARPELVPALVAWRDRALTLLEGRPRLEATLTELRERALPGPSAASADDPRRLELARLQAQVTGLERQLAQASSKTVREPTAEELGLDWSRESDDPEELRALAFAMAEFEGRAFGEEPRALLLARRALELAADRPPAQVAAFRHILAVALFSNGRYEEALAEAQRGLSELGDGDASTAVLHASLLDMGVDVAGYESPAGRALVEDLVASARKRAARLSEELAQPEEWRFESTQDRWWHDQLDVLVRGMRALADPESGLLAGISSEHGWGIERRLEWARTIAERSVTGEPAARLWAEAIAAIADVERCPRYGGLRIEPQLGLLPIGQDPASGLWEFAELQTGAPARRGPDGRLVLEEGTGIVFVLVPGGTFWMGAQRRDPNGRNYDPLADEVEKHESPVLPVTLDPFFMSKYEMTQGQWLRATGTNPSSHTPHMLIFRWNARGLPFSLLHPVEDVSWILCDEVVRRLGLVLPTEAQWEYAARAGTTTPWWTGSEPQSLAGAANLADKFLWDHGAPFWAPEPGFDDGFAIHAPVGSLRPNGFGLHEVTGNVWEFCQDGLVLYDQDRRPGDGLKVTSGTRLHVMRGGGFLEQSVAARSARRDGQQPEQHNIHIGLRPARLLESAAAH